MSGDRHYGTDSTDEFDTLAEATLLPNGTIHITTVIVDKRIPADPNPMPKRFHLFRHHKETQ